MFIRSDCNSGMLPRHLWCSNALHLLLLKLHQLLQTCDACALALCWASYVCNDDVLKLPLA